MALLGTDNEMRPVLQAPYWITKCYGTELHFYIMKMLLNNWSTCLCNLRTSSLKTWFVFLRFSTRPLLEERAPIVGVGVVGVAEQGAGLDLLESGDIDCKLFVDYGIEIATFVSVFCESSKFEIVISFSCSKGGTWDEDSSSIPQLSPWVFTSRVVDCVFEPFIFYFSGLSHISFKCVGSMFWLLL